MKQRLMSSLGAGIGIFIYDLLVHGDHPIDWYKPIFVFSIVFIMTSSYSPTKNNEKEK